MRYATATNSWYPNARAGVLVTVLLCCMGGGIPAQEKSKGAQVVERLVLEEQLIEGKIRRPQLVLITAEARPVFGSLALESLGPGAGITRSVDRSLLEWSPNSGPFQFSATNVSNYVP